MKLMTAYEQGLDVHILTAAAINGIDPEVVTKEQRAAAKPVNFGSIYGTPFRGSTDRSPRGYRGAPGPRLRAPHLRQCLWK